MELLNILCGAEQQSKAVEMESITPGGFWVSYKGGDDTPRMTPRPTSTSAASPTPREINQVADRVEKHHESRGERREREIYQQTDGRSGDTDT